MKPLGLLFLAALLSGLATEGWASSYTGSQPCQACHETAFSDWQESHHYQAMLPATEETVLGNFDDAVFEYGGLQHRFFRRDGKFFVFTDNAGGEMQEFEINFTFGFHPLQQYLVGFPGGRYQALSIVWDSRPEGEGGQRWYHLYPEQAADQEAVDHEDLLHWTGSFQNWNGRCAACHSTELNKNYSLEEDEYTTTWAEINVGCEACHGPASAHLDWANGDRASNDPGFSNPIPGKGAWVPDGNKPTLKSQGGGNAHGQAGVCAACHSRRFELDEDHAGKPFDDLFQLRLLEEDLYYADGQVLDEVYVFGSFLQSKMSRAGVACTNCHQPHSGKLLTEGNGLCAQCHQPAVFDQPSHHHHSQDSEGAACVNCHMPSTTYMGVDERRDHSFRVPEPQLTLDLGIPNACNRCHEDQDATWASEAVKNWYPDSEIRADFAYTLAAAHQGQQTVLPNLVKLANDPARSDILRATAMLEAGHFPSNETVALIQVQLNSPDPLMRAAAVRSMEWLPIAQRYTSLQPLISDPSKSVRMEVAVQLASLSPNQISANGRDELVTLKNEYLETLKLNADIPETLLNLGSYLAQAGNPEEAEQAYRRALKQSPGFVPAMVNLADLYRAAGLEDAALSTLQKALEAEPDSATTQHALGLLYIRQRNMKLALAHLQKAAELDSGNVRYAYVYGVALYDLGQKEQAIQVLERALETHPGSPELISALRAYYQQLGETEKLQRLGTAPPH